MAAGAAPFVGRRSEAAALARHRAAAGDGAGRIVLVTGEAGIGKTRVVEEVVGPPGTARVSWGRCHEGGGAPAFWPWLEALRPILASQPRQRL
ncbi:AAA family ATPase, partial [Candidatus Binatia bacterium]|nr:AAA family ATPase [Candidatus Binatia bacterium]